MKMVTLGPLAPVEESKDQRVDRFKQRALAEIMEPSFQLEILKAIASSGNVLSANALTKEADIITKWLREKYQP